MSIIEQVGKLVAFSPLVWFIFAQKKIQANQNASLKSKNVHSARWLGVSGAGPRTCFIASLGRVQTTNIPECCCDRTWIVSTEEYRCLVFGSHKLTIAGFRSAQTNCTKGEHLAESDSTALNNACLKTHLEKHYLTPQI